MAQIKNDRAEEPALIWIRKGRATSGQLLNIFQGQTLSTPVFRGSSCAFSNCSTLFNIVQPWAQAPFGLTSVELPTGDPTMDLFESCRDIVWCTAMHWICQRHQVRGKAFQRSELGSLGWHLPERCFKTVSSFQHFLMFSFLKLLKYMRTIKNCTFNSLQRHFLHVFDDFHVLIETWKLRGGNWAEASALPYQSQTPMKSISIRQEPRRDSSINWLQCLVESCRVLSLVSGAAKLHTWRRWGLRRPILREWMQIQKLKRTGRRPSPGVSNALHAFAFTTVHIESYSSLMLIAYSYNKLLRLILLEMILDISFIMWPGWNPCRIRRGQGVPYALRSHEAWSLRPRPSRGRQCPCAMWIMTWINYGWISKK